MAKIIPKGQRKEFDIRTLDPGFETGVKGKKISKPETEPIIGAEIDYDVPIDLIAPAISLPFTLWALKEGADVLKLTEKEAKKTAREMKPAIDKYIAPLVKDHFALIAAGAALVGMATEKSKQLSQFREEESKRKAAEKNGEA